MRYFAIALLFMSSVVYADCTSTTIITPDGRAIVCTVCPEMNYVLCT